MKIQIPQNVEMIISRLEDNGYQAYAVGGCVRDMVLGRVPKDWDITTSARPQEVKAIFKRTIDTGIQHGTVTVMMGKEGYEITTYRIDGEYGDSRHPDRVIFTANLSDDLARRDFTINAMAYHPIYGIVDEFGGVNDIKKGIIRCVGNPIHRFEEDALRMLRAVRFSAELGFDIENNTKDAILQKASAINKISAERIRVELNRILCSDHADRLVTAWQLGITREVLPELDKLFTTKQNNPHHCFNVGEHTIQAMKAVNKIYYETVKERNDKLQSILVWAMLFHDIGKPYQKTTDENGIDHFYGHPGVSSKMSGSIMRRLKFDNYTIEMVRRLVQWHDYHFESGIAAMRRAMNRIGDDLMDSLLIVETADIMAQSEYQRDEKLNRICNAKKLIEIIREQDQCFSLKDLNINGKDLIELGIPAGKKIGETLSGLLELVMETPELNEKEALKKLAETWNE